ncbi:MAG: hypothetical protein RI952_1036 [Bacteroidota bacterium]
MIGNEMQMIEKQLRKRVAIINRWQWIAKHKIRRTQKYHHYN